MNWREIKYIFGWGWGGFGMFHCSGVVDPQTSTSLSGRTVNSRPSSLEQIFRFFRNHLTIHGCFRQLIIAACRPDVCATVVTTLTGGFFTAVCPLPCRRSGSPEDGGLACDKQTFSNHLAATCASLQNLFRVSVSTPRQ